MPVIDKDIRSVQIAYSSELILKYPTAHHKGDARQLQTGTIQYEQNDTALRDTHIWKRSLKTSVSRCTEVNRSLNRVHPCI